MIDPARADCQASGSTVSCTGNDPDGFASAAAVDVTVQNGATVDGDPNFGVGIDLLDGNTVINNGAIVGPQVNLGVQAGNNNANITNNSTITATGFGSRGISVNDTNVVTNNGTITSSGFLGSGIVAGNDNTIVNNSIISAKGTGGVGIIANDSNLASGGITNNGTITVGGNGTGIRVNNSNTVNNNGAIVTGNDGFGIALRDNNRIVNSGTITVGNDAAAILLGSTTNTLINTGTILAGARSFSITSFGAVADILTISNKGTIDGRIDFFNSIGVATTSTFKNEGLITITNADTPFTTHTVPGSFEQTAAGTLALRVSTSTAGAGYDHFVVIPNDINDTLKLNGTLRAVVQPGLYAASQKYLSIVDFCGCFGNISGTFATVQSTSPFLAATATYNPTTIDLTLDRIPFGSAPGETQNQRAIGNALEPFYSTTLTGKAAAFFTNLFAATSLGALDQLSGQGTAAIETASLSTGTLFNTAMQNQALNGDLSGATAVTIPPAQFAPTRPPRGQDAFAALKPSDPPGAQAGRWRIWSLGFGAYRSVDGNATDGGANQSMHSYGGAIGIDHQISSDLLLGFSAGGSESNSSVASLATTGQTTGGHVGLYGVKTWGPYYVSAVASYARFDNSTTRSIVGVGPTETATGKFASDQLSARFEFGWKKAFAGYTLTPFVAVEPAALWAHGYAETSTTAGGVPGVLGLSFAAHTTTSLPTFLGLQADTQAVFSNGAILTPYVRGSWVHEFEPSRQVTGTFQLLPTASFTVDGARAASDSARIDTGAKFALDSGRSVFANLSGEWSNVGQSYAATAGFRLIR